MINKKNMPKSYWVEAANAIVYLMNWCTTLEVHDVTPHEKFFGKKLDLSYVRIFNSVAYVHIPDRSNRSSFPSRRNVSS